MRQLSLSLIGPKGASGSRTIEVDACLTGQELRQRVREALELEPEADVHLSYQNGCRNAAKVPIDEAQSLEAQGVVEGATITCKVNTAEVNPKESVLRQSIERNGASSYYYAHANEKELPPEVRYAYGGSPTKLAEAEREDAGEALPAQAIEKYAWADEGDVVAVYINTDGELDAVTAAKDGKNGEVKASFEARGVSLRIQGPARDYALVLRDLEHEIVPEESKYRVSAGKRITLKLKKRRQEKWTRLVRPK